MRRFGVLATSVVLVTAVGCGGGDARPSADELSKALTNEKAAKELKLAQKLDAKKGDCIAKVLVASKLSDKALRSIVENEKYKPGKADQAALAAIAPKLGVCLAGSAG